jgi:hypothetical protein
MTQEITIAEILMKTKNRQIGMYLWVIAVLAVGLWALGEYSGRAWAQGQGPFLADRHQAKGLNCATCHKENPPKAAVPSEICGQCHGDYAKLAEKTSAVQPHNPHDSHLGEVACDQCHHGHKTSENACGQCHTFGFKVP